jgi:hypothetical protein
MIINELHLHISREQSLDRQREAEKARLIRQITLQKGDYPMVKMAARYARYALAALATVGFGSTLQ